MNFESIELLQGEDLDVRERIQRNWKVLRWKANSVNVWVLPRSALGSRGGRRVFPRGEDDESGCSEIEEDEALNLMTRE